ncbi:MAG TPA: hypothetical protein VEN79_18095 [Terriglobia bacterium]|nr:hypothetical protein [Terriglobia bacterium]
MLKDDPHAKENDPRSRFLKLRFFGIREAVGEILRTRFGKSSGILLPQPSGWAFFRLSVAQLFGLLGNRCVSYNYAAHQRLQRAKVGAYPNDTFGYPRSLKDACQGARP